MLSRWPGGRSRRRGQRAGGAPPAADEERDGLAALDLGRRPVEQRPAPPGPADDLPSALRAPLRRPPPRGASPARVATGAAAGRPGRPGRWCAGACRAPRRGTGPPRSPASSRGARSPRRAGARSPTTSTDAPQERRSGCRGWAASSRRRSLGPDASSQRPDLGVHLVGRGHPAPQGLGLTHQPPAGPASAPPPADQHERAACGAPAGPA